MANSTLGMIRGTIVTRDKDTILRLYKTLHGYIATVRILHPGMESIPETGYGKTGESAKKSHKNDSRLQVFSYEERLIRCGLTTLEKRRSRGDLIEAYKIITGKESIQSERFFELAPSKVTRGHRYKLFKKR